MGQADAVPTIPTYDTYLRRACAERALKLHNRNYGYRTVLSGGIVDGELDVADGLVSISELLNNVEEFSDRFCSRLEVEINKRKFDFRSTYNCPTSDTSNSHTTNRAPATSAISVVGNCCNPPATPC